MLLGCRLRHSGKGILWWWWVQEGCSVHFAVEGPVRDCQCFYRISIGHGQVWLPCSFVCYRGVAYDMKLQSVDIPMASGPDQCLFLIGDEEGYRIGGGLISELCDPDVKALAAADEFEARDEKEDAARKLEEIERNREEVEKIEKCHTQKP